MQEESLNVRISVIAAMTATRVIGRKEGGIPWHLPRDITRFRTYTENRYMLLGRKTYEEMNGWFTTQKPIVMSRQAGYVAGEGVPVVADIAGAIQVVAEAGGTELVISGGGEIYAATLHLATSLLLTQVHAEVEGDVFFPDHWAGITWREIHRETFDADDENVHAMDFVWLERDAWNLVAADAAADAVS